MGDGLTISERAIQAREARRRARRVGNPAPPAASRDPWHYAGPQGSWSRPDIDQGPRNAPDGLFERAREAPNFGSNHRFEMLARRVDRLFRS